MAKVKTLREDVYKKIAAGEVVERPLSVVKELVENAIDAGADSITVEVNEGGKTLIKVSDNGSGFHPDDIETAFKNHSTSKINELADFDSLRTLGFRGEALPSIMEVSKIEIETSDNTDGFGVYCTFRDGHLEERKEIACKKGTTISVSDLFYNFPVRRKFLKTDRTELNRIVSFLEPLTLVNYRISIQLIHNGRTVFMYKRAESLKERIYQVFGKDFLDTLQPLEYESGGYAVRGYISRLNTGVSVKKHQYFFVNGRGVREKTLIASLNNAFQNYLEKHRNPVAILLLEIPPQEVDVNIHPMKLEIKFVDSRAVYQFIVHAVRSVFSLEDEFRGEARTPGSSGGGGDYSTGYRSGPSPDGGYGSPYSPRAGDSFQPDPIHGGSRDGGFRDHRPGREGTLEPWTPVEPQESDQTQLFTHDLLNREDFILIGQYRNSYIIIERNGELLIVDQHNAHERANFDRLKQEYIQGKVESISPLFPVIIELSTSEAAGLTPDKLQLLEKLGFRMEPLSGNSFDIKSFPQVLGEPEVKDAVMELIHMPEDQVRLEDKVLAQVACKSAIKINHKLYPDQMKTIVKDLFKSTNPYFCPHKRPIIIDLTLEEIEKRLKRK